MSFKVGFERKINDFVDVFAETSAKSLFTFERKGTALKRMGFVWVLTALLSELKQRFVEHYPNEMLYTERRCLWKALPSGRAALF